MTPPIALWRDALDRAGCNPRPSGDGLKALCPLCQRDGRRHSPALSVRPGTTAVLTTCHHERCEHRDIAAALGLDSPAASPSRASCVATRRKTSTREIPKPANPEVGEIPPGLRHPITAVWTYHGADGAELFRICRIDTGEGKKEFRAARRDKGSPTGWWSGMGSVEPVPYNLPSVLDVARHGGTVHVAEGEKCAAAILEHGPDRDDYTATTNAFGAGHWRDSFSDYLRGASRVVVHQDRDPKGRGHVEKVAASVRRVVPDVRSVLPAEPHHDIADHLAAGLALDATVPAPTPASTTGASREDETSIPELPALCWRHGFAQFRTAWTRSTEASDAFLFGSYLTVAGLVLGRNATLECGIELYPNIYETNVGPSGRSRKSTAQAKGGRLLSKVDEGVEVSPGIGSPEGLIGLLADERGAPKRVLVNLGEIATLLRKGAQDATRGLLPLIVHLYDCPDGVRLPNRGADLSACEPFLSIMGSTTAAWLRGSLSVEDARAGVANRFVYMVGREKPAIPFPPPPNAEALSEAEDILVSARDRHSTRRTYPLAPEARRLWEDWYIAERGRRYETEMLECLAQRLHVHAWKLALVYAALESTVEITADQLAAACAFADYQREALVYVFEGFGDSAAVQIDNRIVGALKRHGPLAGWELQQRVRHVDAETFNRRLTAMARLGVVEERSGGRSGRKRLWHLMGDVA